MSNKKKQSSVDWLQEQLECFGNRHELQMSWDMINYLFKQTKTIEKKQIENAYKEGWKAGECGSDSWEKFYYNRTHGGNK
jgi:hypothetical protein